MLILALECSTSQGSVAVLDSLTTIAKKNWAHQNSTSSNGEIVVPMVKEILDEQKIKIKDIDLFAVDLGPGRFTGVRVGINTIKSFSFVTKKPILAFSSLEILAENSDSNSNLPILTLINAHKNMVYGATLDYGPAAYKISELEELVNEPYLCIGDGYDSIIESASNKLKSNLIRVVGVDDFPRAEKLGSLAFREAKKRPLIDWKGLFPLYIRASEAEEKLKTGELKPVMRTNLKR